MFKESSSVFFSKNKTLNKNLEILNNNTKLPLIIWGDHHSTPLNSNSIAGCLDFLQGLGYSIFGFEFDEEATLEVVMNSTRTSLENVKQMETDLESHNPIPSKFTRDELTSLIKHKPALEARLALFERIKAGEFEYKSLDLNLGENRQYGVHREDTTYHYGEEGYNLRNIKIASNSVQLYQGSNGSGVICFIGLRHMIGIASLLLSSLGKTDFENVIFLHASPENNPDLKLIEAQQKILEKEFLEKSVTFNSFILNDKLVYESVQEIIETKQCVLSRQIPHSNQITLLLDRVYGLEFSLFYRQGKLGIVDAILVTDKKSNSDKKIQTLPVEIQNLLIVKELTPDDKVAYILKDVNGKNADAIYRGLITAKQSFGIF